MKNTLLMLSFALLVLVLTACPNQNPPKLGFTLAATPVIIVKNTFPLGLEPQFRPNPATGSSTITITRDAGFVEAVTLDVEGLPTGVTAIFNPQTTTTNSSNLKLTALSTAPIVSVSVTVKGTASGGATSSTSFNLTIEKRSDTTKPRIISLSPSNGDKGVTENQNIVIRFSERMNKVSAQAAYQSSATGIKPSEVSFSWNSSGTIMTVSPNNKLKYKPIIKLSSPGYSYTYKITNTATDLAGNPLANPQTSRFYTLRKMTQTIYGSVDADIRSDARVGACGDTHQDRDFICIGDSGAVGNADYKAYFGFSIASLPNNINSIVEAKFYAYQYFVKGNPYTELIIGRSHLLIEHVNFGSSISFADFNTPVLRNEGNLTPSTSAPGYKTNTVTLSVKDDYQKRTARANRSQFRLRFAKPTDGHNDKDIAYFRTHEYTGNNKDPKIVIKYLVP